MYLLNEVTYRLSTVNKNWFVFAFFLYRIISQNLFTNQNGKGFAEKQN